jgi:uncharacterized membrane protein
MNWAHAHLLINHVPLFAVLAGLALFFTGAWRQSAELKAAGLWFWVIAGVAAGFAFGTGDEAGDAVSKIPGISTFAIGPHEEAAEPALIVSIVLALLSALLILLRSRLGAAKIWLERGAWVLALAALLLMSRAANLGGRIRHPEIDMVPGAPGALAPLSLSDRA